MCQNVKPCTTWTSFELLQTTSCRIGCQPAVACHTSSSHIVQMSPEMLEIYSIRTALDLKPLPLSHCFDPLQICVIRTLAFDENKAERAQRGLDLGALDAMSWPEYVWEYLYMHEDDLRNHRQGLCSDHTASVRLCCFQVHLYMTHVCHCLCVIAQQTHSWHIMLPVFHTMSSMCKKQ